MKVIQEALRDANEQVSGTGDLLEQAADEITRLKRLDTIHAKEIGKLRAVLQGIEQRESGYKKQVERLQVALKESNLALNLIVGQVVEGSARTVEEFGKATAPLLEATQRLVLLDQTVRATRDGANKAALEALE